MKHDAARLFYGAADRLDLLRQVVFVERREIDLHVPRYIGICAELCGEQVGCRGFGNAVERAQPCEDGGKLLPREHGGIERKAFHDGNTAARALFGKERDAGFADVFDITVDGAARHAEFFREIRRGNVAFLLNGRNDADEAVGFHFTCPLYPQYSTPMWKTK